MYKYYQPNKKDKKDKHGDCVIRSLCKATGKEWLEVFDELIPIARKFQCAMNEKKVYDKFLKNNGFIYVGVSNQKGSKRPTVGSFTKDNHGTCVMRVAKHLVTCIDGFYYDTWDCGHKSLYGYWVKG